MCLDERRVSRVDLSSRHVLSRNCVEVCCCDMQGHSNNDGMSLVLASLSSAFYTCYSKICDTKCPVSCVQRPFWPPLGSGKTLQSLRVTFLLFAVTCKLFFISMILCFGVFFCLFLFRLFVFPNMTPLPFVQGLVDKCMSM